MLELLGKDYSKHAPDYDESRYLGPKARFTSWCETRLLRHAITQHAGQRRLAVDVACGTGHFTLRVADLFERIVGIDLTKAMIDRARAKAVSAGAQNVHFVRGRADDIPLPDGIADVVITTRFLHLFPSHHHPHFLVHMLRILRPGGLLIVEHDWLPAIVRRGWARNSSVYRSDEVTSAQATRVARLGVSAPGLPTLSLGWPSLARTLSSVFVQTPLNRLASFLILAYRKH